MDALLNGIYIYELLFEKEGMLKDFEIFSILKK